MKLLFRIFLSLSWLLPVMSNATHARVTEDCILYSPARSVIHAAYIVPPFKVCDEFPAHRYTPATSETMYEWLFAAEHEDDNTQPPVAKKKKSAAKANYFTSFYTTTSRYFPYFIKDDLPFCKHFSYSSSYRQSLLCVFRV